MPAIEVVDEKSFQDQVDDVRNLIIKWTGEHRDVSSMISVLASTAQQIAINRGVKLEDYIGVVRAAWAADSKSET